MENEITANLVEKFSENYIKQLKKSASIFGKSNNVKTNMFLPKAFIGESVSVNAFYSTDREHLMLVFLNSDKYKFNFSITSGNVFDIFDPYKIWNKNKATAIRIDNSRNININSVNVIGMRPLDLYGEIELIAENFTFSMPYPNNTTVKLDYVMVFSKQIFLDLTKDQFNFANQIALSYSDYFDLTGEKLNLNKERTEEYKEYLNEIKNSMAEYFFNTQYKETEIDEFIAKHPEILKYGLGIINYISQIELKDIHGDYKQNLKPDLVGFDSVKETWVIVDYKLPNKKLVRGQQTVRAALTADITVLKKQLKVYRDYFSDSMQRNYVNNLYEININKYPFTIGVIGTVTAEERDDFNEERAEHPNWFSIVSYDELYKKVCQFIDTVLKINWKYIKSSCL